MKIALDPTPFHHSHSLLELPRVAADLGYKYLQLTPHADVIPFHNHPKADDELVGQLNKACRDAGIEIASVLPVLRWSVPDGSAPGGSPLLEARHPDHRKPWRQHHEHRIQRPPGKG